MLPLDITILNMQEYLLLDINGTKRKFFLNVNGNYSVLEKTFEIIQK